MKEPADSKERFTERVAAYVAARPGYPQGVIDVLRERAGLRPEWAVADIGSGTGISTGLFLSAGCTVFAIEPNDAMRAAAERQHRRASKFHSVNGSAEATTLTDRSVDFVVAAQAFHWFDVAAFRAETLRILRPGGWGLLLWNDRDDSADEFAVEYERLLRDFGTDYTAVQHRNVGRERIEAFFGGRCDLIELPNAQSLDFDGLRDRLLSSSYVPREGDTKFGPMLDRLRDVFDRTQSDGAVAMRYRTQLFLGQVHAAASSRRS